MDKDRSNPDIPKKRDVDLPKSPEPTSPGYSPEKTDDKRHPHQGDNPVK